MAEMITIDDGNYQQFINPIVDGERKLCSSFGMFNASSSGFESSIPAFEDQETIPLIPESEWDDRIAQQRRDKSRVIDFMRGLDIEVLNQDGLPYCWCYGVTTAAMVCRAKETGREIRYSCESVAAPVKQYRQHGGWGEEALMYAVKYGWMTPDMWPNLHWRDDRYRTPENLEIAKRHRPAEWYRTTKWEQIVSSILAGYPVAVGYNWWGHLVCGVDIEERTHDLVIANSWGTSWSDGGFGKLSGQKKYPDGQSVAICSMTAI